MIEINRELFEELIEARNELDLLLHMYSRKKSVYDMEKTIEELGIKYGIIKEEENNA